MIRRPLTIAVCAATVAGALAGCGSSGKEDAAEQVVVTVTSTRHRPVQQTSAAPVTVTTTVKKDGAPAQDKTTAADSKTEDPLTQVYRSILANPTLVPFRNPSGLPINPSGDYRYTLADLDGDNRPEMLLNIGMEETGLGYTTIGYVAVVMGTSAPGAIVTAEGVTLDGAASAGGSRAATLIPTPGTTGLAEVFYHSIQPETSNNIYSLDKDNTIVKQSEYKDRINTNGPWKLPTPAGFCVPVWHRTTDPSLANSLSTGRCES